MLQEICRSDLLDVTLASDVVVQGRHLSVLGEDQLEDISGSFYKLSNLSIKGHVFWQSGLIGHLRKNRYDVVILLGDYKILTYYLCLIICRVLGIKSLLWTHGLLNPDHNVIKKIVRSTFYRLSDGLLLYGNRARKLLRDTLGRDFLLYVIGNSVDYDTISKFVNIEFEARDPRKLVYIGRINADKKLDLLFKAMQETKHEVTLEVIGDGSAVATLRALADTLDRCTVTFYGEMHCEKSISQVMNSSSVAVVPGDIGLSAIHSLSYGLPVVTHDRFDLHKPEVEALIESDAGHHYKYDDVTDLARAIDSALENANEKRLTCVRTIEKSFTPQSQLVRIEEAVSRLLN